MARMSFRPPRLAVPLISGAWLIFAAPFTSRAADSANNLVFPTGQRESADKIIRAATASDFAHHRLAELCDTFGPRFSGTTNLEAAIDWVLAEMKRDGLANVHGEPVKVPHWERGAESLELLQPRGESLPMLGLGGSTATFASHGAP